jgi:hypothetical protein
MRDEAHFGSLKNRLREPMVKMLMEAVLFDPDFISDDFSAEDISYAVDLGLLKADSADGGHLKPANPIYHELAIRTLTDWLRKKCPMTCLTSGWTGAGLTWMAFSGLSRSTGA